MIPAHVTGSGGREAPEEQLFDRNSRTPSCVSQETQKHNTESWVAQVFRGAASEKCLQVGAPRRGTAPRLRRGAAQDTRAVNGRSNYDSLKVAKCLVR